MIKKDKKKKTGQDLPDHWSYFCGHTIDHLGLDETHWW
jgi:hypothetical protein